MKYDFPPVTDLTVTTIWPEFIPRVARRAGRESARSCSARTSATRRLEPERREDAAAIEVSIEQQDVTFVGELVVREAGPSNYERVRITRERAAGRDQHRILAPW